MQIPEDEKYLLLKMKGFKESTCILSHNICTADYLSAILFIPSIMDNGHKECYPYGQNMYRHYD